MGMIGKKEKEKKAHLLCVRWRIVSRSIRYTDKSYKMVEEKRKHNTWEYMGTWEIWEN